MIPVLEAIRTKLQFAQKFFDLGNQQLAEIRNELGLDGKAGKRGGGLRGSTSRLPSHLAIGTGLLPALNEEGRYDVNDAARFLGLKSGTVRQHIKLKKLKVERDGRKIIVTGSEIIRRKAELSSMQETGE